MTVSYWSLLSLLFIITSCSFERSKNEDLAIPGLQSPVTVTTDAYGIPHIEANNELDAYRALGFVMASDRLFQMDILRRVANGELSEIFGKDTLKKDILLRRLGLRRTMDANWPAIQKNAPQEVIALMDAFFAGVNYFIKTGPLPLEMSILRYRPRPFQPVEALAISGYLSLTFAQGLTGDVLYSDLSDEVAPGDLALLFANDRLGPNKSTSHYRPTRRYYQDIATTLNGLTSHYSLFYGSNAWLLSGKRSQSGFPLLANDPHISVSNPSIWYEAHIKTPKHEIYGHFIPLSPFAGLGHHKTIAWGITMSEMDDLDLYQETFHPKNPDLVKYKGEYVAVEKISETIKVKGEDDHTETVVITPHGPLLDGLDEIRKRSGLALKWSYHQPGNDPATALYKLSRAKTYADVPKALSHATSPSFAISWADRDNIAVHYMGANPIRPQGIDGKAVLEGASGNHEYLGYMATRDNPHLVNPASGVIVSANAQPPQHQDKKWQGYWQSNQRYERLHELLAQKQKWSLDGLKKITADVYAQRIDNILTILKVTLKPLSSLEKQAFTILAKWNGAAHATLAAPAIYYMFYVHLLRELLQDELGADRLLAYNRNAHSSYLYQNIFHHPNSQLWDHIGTPQRESMKDTINLAFQKAVAELKDRLGPKSDHWQWGQLHQITFKHALGQVFPLNYLYNLGPYPVPGANSHINNMCFSVSSTSFDVTVAPSTRRLIDLATPELSYGILPTGNSGNVFSTHYNDQTRMYLKTQFRAQHMSLDTVKKNDHQRFTIRPL